MNHRNSYDFVYRFDSAAALLDRLPAMGPFYAQGRVRGAGLGRTVPAFSPIRLPGLEQVCDPDAGIAFSADLLRGVLAGLAGGAGGVNGTDRIGDVLEFEFAPFPGALSLHKFPTSEQPAAILDSVGGLPGCVLDEYRVAAWKASLPQPATISHGCRRRAARRCVHPERLPVFHVLQHAVEEGLCLDFRIASQCVDLAACFTPALLKQMGPFLVAVDGPAEHACHLDLRLLHQLEIRRCYLEGAWFSRLQVWNVYGEPQLQLLAEDGDLVRFWTVLCEEGVGGF